MGRDRILQIVSAISARKEVVVAVACQGKPDLI
jgi:hypothetical protein